MKLVVNPPTPWPDWQAPVSTRKTRPTIMERAVEGNTSRGQQQEAYDRAVQWPLAVAAEAPNRGRANHDSSVGVVGSVS